jgi:hypothetical protein
MLRGGIVRERYELSSKPAIQRRKSWRGRARRRGGRPRARSRTTDRVERRGRTARACPRGKEAGTRHGSRMRQAKSNASSQVECVKPSRMRQAKSNAPSQVQSAKPSRMRQAKSNAPSQVQSVKSQVECVKPRGSRGSRRSKEEVTAAIGRARRRWKRKEVRRRTPRGFAVGVPRCHGLEIVGENSSPQRRPRSLGPKHDAKVRTDPRSRVAA